MIKICFTCYLKRGLFERTKIITWGRECHDCHRETPSMAILYKVAAS